VLLQSGVKRVVGITQALPCRIGDDRFRSVACTLGVLDEKGRKSRLEVHICRGARNGEGGSGAVSKTLVDHFTAVLKAARLLTYVTVEEPRTRVVGDETDRYGFFTCNFLLDGPFPVPPRPMSTMHASRTCGS